jgi:hypothetical protein
VSSSIGWRFCWLLAASQGWGLLRLAVCGGTEPNYVRSKYFVFGLPRLSGFLSSTHMVFMQRVFTLLHGTLGLYLSVAVQGDCAAAAAVSLLYGLCSSCVFCLSFHFLCGTFRRFSCKQNCNVEFFCFFFTLPSFICVATSREILSSRRRARRSETTSLTTLRFLSCLCYSRLLRADSELPTAESRRATGFLDNAALQRLYRRSACLSCG